MTSRAGVSRGSVIHLRRFPVRLIMTSTTVIDGAAVMRSLVAGGARPVKSGPAITRVAGDALQAGMYALELAGVIGLGRPPGGRAVASTAPVGQGRPVTFAVTTFAGTAVEIIFTVFIAFMAVGAFRFGVFGNEEAFRGLNMFVVDALAAFVTLQAVAPDGPAVAGESF